MPEFRTSVEVHLWPVTGLSLLPEKVRKQFSGFTLTTLEGQVRFRGEEIDIAGTIRLTPDEETVDVTLWNIGDPHTVMSVFRKNYLMAVDLSRTDAMAGEQPKVRAVLSRIKSVKIVRREDSSDIGYRVRAIPITSALDEIEVQHSFTDREWYPLREIIETLLRDAGVDGFKVECPNDVGVTHFVADGPVRAEIERAAAKASAPMGVAMRGGDVLVTNRVIGAYRIPEAAVLDANWTDADEGGPAIPQPILPSTLQETKEGFDISDEQEPEDEEDVVANQDAGQGYSSKLALSPEIFPNSQVVHQGESVLARMGFIGAKEQAFVVVGVEHDFSTAEDAPMDTTTLTMALVEEA